MFQLVEIICSILLSLSGLIAGFGYAWGQFKDGRNKERIDSITILKSDVEVLRSKVEELTAQVKMLRDENSLEREKFTKAILSISGQDPLMQEFIKNENEFMTYTKLILIRLDKYLNHESF